MKKTTQKIVFRRSVKAMPGIDLQARLHKAGNDRRHISYFMADSNNAHAIYATNNASESSLADQRVF